MNTRFLLSLLAAAALLLAGCARSRADSAAVAEPAPAAVFKVGHGVQLSAAARTFVGLTTAEVEPRTMGTEVTAVPTTALLGTARGNFVYVANGDWFLRTPVTVGARDATHVEVVDGLYEGDLIVVQGARALMLAEIQALNGGVGCADGH